MRNAVIAVFWICALAAGAALVRLLPLARPVELPLAWLGGLVAGLAATVGFVSIPAVAARYRAEQAVRVENLITGWIGFGVLAMIVRAVAELIGGG